MIHNSYILYKTFSNKPNKINTHLKFRIALVEYFSQSNQQENSSFIQPLVETSISSPSVKSKITDHLPCKYPGGKPRRCKYCSTTDKKKTLYYCLKCNKSLCIDRCYAEYHKNLEAT